MGDEARNKFIEGWHAGQAILASKFQKGPATSELLRSEDAKTESPVDEFDAAANS